MPVDTITPHHAINNESHQLDCLPRLVLGYTHTMNMRDERGYYLTTKRRKTYKRDRERLFIAQHGLCYWCGKLCTMKGDGGTHKEFTVDHVIPLSFKGTNHWMNLVGSCYKCNTKRERIWKNYKIIKIEDGEVIPEKFKRLDRTFVRRKGRVPMGRYELIDVVCISNANDPMNGSRGMATQHEIDVMNKDAEENNNPRRWIPAAVATAHVNASDRIWTLMKVVAFFSAIMLGVFYLGALLTHTTVTLKDFVQTAVIFVTAVFAVVLCASKAARVLRKPYS